MCDTAGPAATPDAEPPALSPEQRAALSRAVTRVVLGWFERMIAAGRNPFAEAEEATTARGREDAA